MVMNALLFGTLDAMRAVWFTAAFVGSCVALCALSPLCFLNSPLRGVGIREESLPANLLFVACAKVILLFAGVSVVSTRPRDPADRPTSNVIFAYTHASNLDPIIVAASCGTAPKFIYKRELAFIPLLGWVLYLYNHVPIDRKNRAKAIDSINAAVRKVVTKHQAVAIAPEGTRSKSGALMEFKKGPFHMARDSGARIVPLIITGAYDLCPPKSKWFAPGTVRTTLLPPVENVEGESVDAMCERVRAVFVDAIEAEKKQLPPRGEGVGKARGLALRHYAPSIVATAAVVCGWVLWRRRN